MRLHIVAKLLLIIAGIILLSALTGRFIGFSWEDSFALGMCVLGGMFVLLVAATFFMILKDTFEEFGDYDR